MVVLGVGLLVVSGELTGVAQSAKPGSGASPEVTVPASKAEVGPSGGALGVSDGLADTVKPGEVVVGEGSDGSISVRRVDGKVEKRIAVGGSAGVPEDVKPGVGARAGRVESRVGSVVASFAVDAKPDGVVLELVGADGVGVAAYTGDGGCCGSWTWWGWRQG